MERIVLRHLKGSRAGQTDELPLSDTKEVVFGRETSATVRFDADRDDVVGRLHARLVRDPKDPYRFELVDLNSRNGTFLNRQRVHGSAAIQLGDVIQLGAGGPEIQFDLDPRPAHLVKATRLASGVEGAAAGAPATRVESPEAAVVSAGAARTSVGKATVERIVGNVKQEGRRNVAVVGLAAVALIAAVGFWQSQRVEEVKAEGEQKLDSAQQALLLTQQQLDSIRKIAEATQARTGALTPGEIAARYSGAVVLIDFGWKLLYSETGGQLYHQFIPNEYTDRQGRKHPIMDDGRRTIAAFRYNDRKVEPALTLQDSGFPFGSESRGSGFVVTNDGFILTNRHVAASWMTWYVAWREEQKVGVLVDEQGRPMTGDDGRPILVRAPHNWVPSEALGPRLRGGVVGRLDYLNVYFPNNTGRWAAQIARVSDRHDVALIKIQAPPTLPKVELYDNYETIQVGQAVTVMGYPSVADEAIVVTRSQDAFKKGAEIRVVPDPTVTPGYVGKVLRPVDVRQPGTDEVFFQFGDRIQLTINATGGGNSGGPMFDDQGRVIGIYFAGRVQDAHISFAVPIRYGMELLDVRPNVATR